MLIVKSFSGDKMYVNESGDLHRTDGPAFIGRDGYEA